MAATKIYLTCCLMSLARQRGNFSMLPRFLKSGTMTSSVSWQKCSASHILVWLQTFPKLCKNFLKTYLKLSKNFPKTYQGHLDRCLQGWARWEAAHLPLSTRDQIPAESKVPSRGGMEFCQKYFSPSPFSQNIQPCFWGHMASQWESARVLYKLYDNISWKSFVCVA